MIEVDPEVREALAAGRPVVALESSVLVHGLPWPHNLEAMERMVSTIRRRGAVPAITALIAGQARVGLSDEAWRDLGERPEMPKVSVHNLAYHRAAGDWGGTTVAGTLHLARRAGCRVMATGGIGGVHRGDQADVSADLPMLARTPMLVVASGAKSILDLRRTMEWLETFGVVVVGYGTEEMPAFYARHSGLPLRLRADSAEEAAGVYRAQQEEGLPGAVLVAVPVPEEAEIPLGEMEDLIQAAVAAAEREGIRGAEVTPYILKRLARETDGRALRANLALLENNADVAAEIAAALAAEGAQA